MQEKNSSVARDIESQTRTDNIDTAGSIDNDSLVDTEAMVEPTSTNQVVGDTEIHIPEAFLVEDGDGEVYDATWVSILDEADLRWWKQRRTKILFGVIIVLVGALVIALGVSLSRPSPETTATNNSTILTVFVTPPPSPMITSSSTAAPVSLTPCFSADDGGLDGVLYKAVRAYVNQDCANNQECEIAQTYGWPMNSWCVGNVKDMSGLFQFMDTFNEDISGWNTSSVTQMPGMFSGAKAFNQDVSSFDISSVTVMFGMFADADSFNQDLCSWQDSFPYNQAFNIFANSGCTYQDVPNESQKGPFCASNCTG